MRIGAGWMARLLDAGQETRLREQRKLLRRRPFKRENHYRLQTDAEAPPDSLDHPLALGQLGGGMRNCAVVDLPAEPVPYEAGRKFLHRFEIAAAGARMARRPG